MASLRYACPVFLGKLGQVHILKPQDSLEVNGYFFLKKKMPEGSNWVLRKCYAFKSLENFFFFCLSFSGDYSDLGESQKKLYMGQIK